MQQANPSQTEQQRPRLLFVDDEQRVLNSMRIMFRRNYDLYLASRGSEALEIVDREDIDVIVADHRMPQMTGVEVLTSVRSRSPRTVRILLTGYADLDAVEGSINESEVFRFLTKPCPPQQLKDTVELAAKLAREAPVTEPTDTESDFDSSEFEITEIVLESPPEPAAHAAPSDAATETPADAAAGDAPSDHTQTDVIRNPPHVAAPASEQAPAETPEPPAEPARTHATGLGVVVFSSDEQVIGTVEQAVRGRIPVYRAGNIVQVIKVLTEHRPGVLVTDISTDRTAMQSMMAQLKGHLPELVTVAVSQHRDVLDMVWLINHGQIFRFLNKPLSAGRCAVSLQAALQYHRTLLKSPELVRRHEVDATDDSGVMDGVISKLKSVRRLWASA